MKTLFLNETEQLLTVVVTAVARTMSVLFKSEDSSGEDQIISEFELNRISVYS